MSESTSVGEVYSIYLEVSPMPYNTPDNCALGFRAKSIKKLAQIF